MSDLLFKTDNDISELETGKYALFYNDYYSDDKVLKLSSSLKDIGKVFNCQIKNKTKVLILSEPIKANHDVFGPILVSKILADKIMFAATHHLFLINE